MGQQIVMPQLGESVVEGKIVEWFVSPGDKVETGTPLLEVETDKANTEVPSSEAGFVKAILVEAGSTVDVGTPLIELVQSADEVGDGAPSAEPPEPAESAPAESAPAESAPAESAPAESTPAPAATTAPSSTAPARTAPAPPRPPTASSVRPPPAVPSAARHTNGDADRPWNAGGVVAAPTAKASDLAIARRSSVGAEVEAAVADGRPYGAPPVGKYYKVPTVQAEPDDNVIPFSRRRGIIAEHMVYSKHVSPHVPCFAEVDVTDVMDLRKKHKARLAEQGIPLSLLAFVLKATCQALREFPGVNAVVGDEEIIERAKVNLGVAVETEGGLLVPVIRDADTLSVAGLAKAVIDVAERARTKKITVDDLTGGTFTVTNPGRKGNLFGAAVINQPQVGILRMGEMVRRAVVRKMDGEEVICIRSMMFLGLSYDHRIIDGVTGNGFLFRIRELLEEADFSM